LVRRPFRLARAFFCGGARALLVSHWYVDNGAIVALITKSFDPLRTDPKIGRTEGLRRAMPALTAGGVDRTPFRLGTAFGGGLSRAGKML
jgi:CHAT domain-containing protein